MSISVFPSVGVGGVGGGSIEDARARYTFNWYPESVVPMAAVSLVG